MLSRPLLTYAPDDGLSGGGGSELPAPVEDSQATPDGTPDAGTAGFEQPTVDYEKRFKDAQAWGTKLSQELASVKERAALLDALESDDPKSQAEALARFGIQLDYEDMAPEPQQPQAGVDPELQAKIDYLLEQQQASEAASQQEADYRAFRQMVDPELTQMGLPEELHEIVAEAALTLPGVPDEFGNMTPDLQGAVAQITELAQTLGKLPGVERQRLQQYRETKQAPAISESGTAGTQVPDLSDRKTRQEVLQERWNALEQNA